MPAGASVQTSAFTAKSTGDALQISIGGIQITGGHSEVSWDGSTLTAKGSGELTPALVGNAVASATASNPSSSAPQTCGAPPSGSVPANPLLDLGLACGTASAAINSDGTMAATATGDIAYLDLLNLTGATLGSVASLPTTLSALGQQVIQGTPLAGALQQVLGALPASVPTLQQVQQGLPIPSLLQVISQITQAAGLPQWLVHVAIGDTTSSFSTTSDAVSTTNTSKGATIELLQGLGAGGAPLLEVDVGYSSSSAGWTSAGFTSNHDNAIIRVVLNIPGAAQSIELTPGQTIDLLAGTPLETVITLANGSSSITGKSGTAQGSGLSIDLAKGVQGGVLLNLGTTGVTLSGSPTTTPNKTTAQKSVTSTTAAAAPISVVPTAVHTGEWWSGSLPFVALLLALGGGLLGWPRLRRMAIAGTPAWGRIVRKGLGRGGKVGGPGSGGGLA